MSRSAAILTAGILLGCVGPSELHGPCSMPRIVTKTIGDTVWLGPETCPYQDNLVHWQFENDFFISKNLFEGDYEGVSDPAFMGRAHLHHHNYTLEIRDLGLNDTGTYRLIVSLLNTVEWFSRETFLHVIGPSVEAGQEEGLTAEDICGIAAVLVVIAVVAGFLLAVYKCKPVHALPQLEDEMSLPDLPAKASP